MDGDALLRRWLAQQRELGDEALLLPTLSARQAREIIGVAGGDAGRQARKGGAAPGQPAAPNASSDSADAAASQMSSDWRTELMAAGAGPAGGLPRAPSAPNAQPYARPDRNAPLAPTPDPSGADDIEAVARLVASCRGCELFRTALNPVPGEGNPNADFVCLGEAPGATEDEQGRPFVGQAGQLLTKILAAVNLRREDVFIMNVLKHRPPGNRNPDPVEVAACRPFLQRQLELIRPKVILALGTFAAQTLLATKAPISKLRGQVHQYQGIPVVVTYHPAALLRNPSWKRPAWEDVQFARRILDGVPA